MVSNTGNYHYHNTKITKEDVTDTIYDAISENLLNSKQF